MELYLKIRTHKLQTSLFRVSFIFLLFFFAQHIAAKNLSITLPANITTVKDAFYEIEKQTNMSIDYDESIIDLTRTINVTINNQSLQEALTSILEGSGCTFLIKEKHIIISAQPVRSQQSKIQITITCAYIKHKKLRKSTLCISFDSINYLFYNFSINFQQGARL